MSSLVPLSQRRWLPAPQEGVALCLLHSHEATGEVAAFIRMDEGAKLPSHGHPGGEHIYVVEGCVVVGEELVEAGDYHHTLPGEDHEVVAPRGCLLLSILPKGLSSTG